MPNIPISESLIRVIYFNERDGEGERERQKEREKKKNLKSLLKRFLVRSKFLQNLHKSTSLLLLFLTIIYCAVFLFPSVMVLKAHRTCN